MRARISGGFFILGMLLFTMDPLAGQPGGGKDGKRSFQFQPGGGGFGQPGGGGLQPGGGGFQPGGGGFQPGGGTRFQFQPGGGQPGGGGFQPGGGFGQPGGGGFQPGGGGFGRGGMDPERMFSFMSKGTDSIDLNQLTPEQRQGLKGAFDRMGVQGLPESGTLTKAQFVAAYQQAQAARAAQGAGTPNGFGQPGGPPGAFGQPGTFGQPGAYGQPGGFPMQPGGFGGQKGGMSDEDAIRRFKEADKDQDGRLSWDEASSKSRENWQEIDVNQDRYIDLDEYRNYISRRFGPNAQGGQPQFGMQPQFGQPQFGNDFRGTGEGGGFGRREEKKDDFTNVGIRYGKLPPGLPEWFTEYDQDKDGQVNMYEWRTVGGKSVAEFREKDANGDGFIAPLELIRVESTKAEFDRLMAIQEGEIPQGTGQSRGKGGSMPGGGGKGGFPGFGGGGGPPMMMGKGGGGSPDARPSRDEKRDEKAGERMDRGKNNPFANGGKK